MSLKDLRLEPLEDLQAKEDPKEALTNEKLRRLAKSLEKDTEKTEKEKVGKKDKKGKNE